VDIDEVAHALGEVAARSPVGDLCVTPRAMRVDEHADVAENEDLGEGGEARAADPETWLGLDRVPDEALWEAHQALKERLITEVRRRSALRPN